MNEISHSPSTEACAQVVDEKDTLITLKPRSELLPQEFFRATNLWVVNANAEALISQRAATKDHDPLKWTSAVSGTVEDDETYEDNVRKEAEEEIGLFGADFIPGPKFRITHPRNYFCQWYSVEVDWPIEEFTIQEEEVEQLAWVPFAKLKVDIMQNPNRYTPGIKKYVAECV